MTPKCGRSRKLQTSARDGRQSNNRPAERRRERRVGTESTLGISAERDGDWSQEVRKPGSLEGVVAEFRIPDFWTSGLPPSVPPFLLQHPGILTRGVQFKVELAGVDCLVGV